MKRGRTRQIAIGLIVAETHLATSGQLIADTVIAVLGGHSNDV